MDLSTSKHIIILSVLVSVAILAIAAENWGANGLQASATVILVAITAWYAIQTEKSLKETKKSRRRPYVLSLLTEGIDPLLDQLKSNNRRIKRRNNSKLSDRCSYPVLSLENGLSEEMIADLRRDRPHVATDYEIYRDYLHEYGIRHGNLRLEIRNQIEENFKGWIENKRETLPENLPRDVTVNEKKVTWETLPFLFTDELVNWVLFGFAPKEIVNDIFEPFEADLMRLRDERFQQDFSDLEEMIDDLETLGKFLETDLTSVRDIYLREYDITETEIKSKSD